MGVPLAALAVQQPPSPLEQAAKVLQIRNLANAGQTQQLQQEALGQENQQRQLAIGQTQALNKAYSEAIKPDANGQPTIDTDALQKSLASNNAGAAIPQVLESVTKFQKSQLDLKTSAADLQQKQADMLGHAAAAIKAAGYDPRVAHTLLSTFPQSPQLAQIQQGIDNPQILKQWVDTSIANSPKERELAAQEKTAGARAQGAETSAEEFKEKLPGGALYAPTLAGQEAQSRLNVESSPQAVNAAAKKAAAEASARLPFQLAQKKAEQAITQGDPAAAAQLLVNGDATLSQLKARGVTPDFIQQTLNAANQLSGGKFNAQQAEASFKVAQSPENVRFFGSAKSLTDKGGTLDQLADAAKGIPQNQIPLFNSIADAEKAATGSGPIAKYAAVALGVADDYAKVMGGGQGSDTSRTQALQLIGAKQSPQQRAASIEGIRGAVSSQTNSRIGNNPVLKRMYGDTGGTYKPPAGAPTATGPNGHKIVVDGGKWVDAQTGKPIQ